MTLPAATFTPVAPPPDGLAVAFTAARRRRNSKAAVSAFTGAVAIASVLSFLAPPGQSLVQEPAQPAHGGLLPGLPDAPPHGASAPLVRTPASASSVADALATSTEPLGPAGSGQVRTATSPLHHTCDRTRIACVVVRVPAPGGPTLRASVCPAAASVTVDDAPEAGATRTSSSRTVEVGRCPS